ncbi:hypothetical protein [Paenibacillus sp. MMO-58]|uniref:hypothetical protein n=1 Tax=Paenibacillus sp. MMO-58 TaxID=3081290 RepID=UPI00301B220E
MKNHDGIDYYTIGEVSKIVGVSTITLKLYYEWATQNNKLADLPAMRDDLTNRGTRFLKADEINKINTFRESRQRGDMAALNEEKYGNRKEYKTKWMQEKRARDKAETQAARIEEKRPTMDEETEAQQK